MTIPNPEASTCQPPPELFPADTGNGEVQYAKVANYQALAILSHELRHPLSVFQSAVDLISSRGEQDQRIKELLREQVEQMTCLVDDLSDLARNVHGKTRLQPRTVQLQPIVDTVLMGLQRTVAMHGQQIEAQIEPRPIWLHADRFRISQILRNLISNASKYSDEGQSIYLTVASDQQRVEIRVRDEGIGIEPADLNRIFDLFSQSESASALDHREGGLGIGLSLVHHLVELHQGSVEATSDGKGCGSEFVVRLPTVPRPINDASSPESCRAIPSARVMIVDDRRDTAFMLTALLNKLGSHQVQTAADGPAALAALDRFLPDLILLDLGLPGMSGLDLARKIRQREDCRQILLVALTGYDDDSLRDQANAARIDLYRVKPASIDMLRGILTHPRLVRSEPA